MDEKSQTAHVESDIEALMQFAKRSEILSLERFEHDPCRIRLVFDGIGLGPGDTIDDEVEPRERHECDLEFPKRYPDQPPRLRWQTPIYHPNVSSSGFVDHHDFGFKWDAEASLTALCESIWNTVRFARVDLSDVKNMTAKRWVERQTEFELPLDVRDLRGSVRPHEENVVHYRRRGDHSQLAENEQEPDESVPVFIGEDAGSDFVPVEIVEPIEIEPVVEISDDSGDLPQDDPSVGNDRWESTTTTKPPTRESQGGKSASKSEGLFFIDDEGSEGLPS